MSSRSLSDIQFISFVFSSCIINEFLIPYTVPYYENCNWISLQLENQNWISLLYISSEDPYTISIVRIWRKNSSDICNLSVRFLKFRYISLHIYYLALLPVVLLFYLPHLDYPGDLVLSPLIMMPWSGNISSQFLLHCR
jgi:hypothetical protein